jgi:hypothetical protein
VEIRAAMERVAGLPEPVNAESYATYKARVSGARPVHREVRGSPWVHLSRQGGKYDFVL